ncbi:MAG: type II toxin-antitoxin system Phd/YefM family antitoxin [Candidatus Sungbacteria bacterium]|uniref:Antitoxin n=1 Tax=Candidatus Sungiibacteriota bacterium TaxID=2750080 RepID=A0A932VPP5_9BACT|nr:type II toxin-antitoxin system Phd/YefM family antitoxin [Candidatus Sungbacteria bacterium]
MDFAKIKNLVKGNGDRVILLENGEPEAVVMSFAEYEKLAAGVSARQGSEEEMRAEEAGLGETEFIGPAMVSAQGTFHRPEEIRLEDLPL